jgi:DNA (cytosine-5)-methyltransferase 1
MDLAIALAENTIGRKPMNGGNGDGFTEGGPMYTLNATGVHGVAHQLAIPINTMTVQGRPSDDLNPRMGLGIGEPGDPCPTITSAHSHAVAAFQQTADCLTSAYGTKWNGNGSATNGSLFANHNMAVRRLTPTECERLQGFPDGYTNIKDKCTDGPRYKALGNSMAVPVMKWIGERIKTVDSL